MSFYLYTESAFYHEGDKSILKKLIDETVHSGASGIKFQVLIDIDSFVSSKSSSYEIIKPWILSREDWLEVFGYATAAGLDIILMPLDVAAVELSKSIDVKYMEVHSVSFKDEALLKALERVKTPLIFGAGGRTLDEISVAVNRFSDRTVVIMTGFQAFPSKLEEIGLGKIGELAKLFPQSIIGYADHSSYDDEMAVKSCEYAYILGARIFEKHIALEEGSQRTDFQSAVSADKIALIIKNLQTIQAVLKDKSQCFNMCESELTYRKREKIPVAARSLEAGEILSGKDLTLKMYAGKSCDETADMLIGRRLVNDIGYDEPVSGKDIE